MRAATTKRQTVQRQIALLLQDAGKKDDAIHVLEKLVSMTPASVEAQVQIGDIYRGDEQLWRRPQGL
jgi:predicted Zn-dependent protease